MAADLELHLLANMAKAIGISEVELGAPMASFSAADGYLVMDHVRHRSARAQVADWWSGACERMFDDWLDANIIYEDEYMGDVRPLNGKLLLPTRSTFNWVAA